MRQKLHLGDNYALTKNKREPYTIRYISLLAVLMSMCLYAVKQVSAQQAEPAATAVANIKPLLIGDTIPEYLWNLPLQVVNHPEGKDTITLNDYRGKLIILDFWATWCGSCVAALPKMVRLSDKFKDRVTILPITEESLDKTAAFLVSNPTTKELQLTSVAMDTALLQFFRHRIIPHLVWIDKNARVMTTSDHSLLNATTVNDVLRGKITHLPAKVDFDYDYRQPFQYIGILEMSRMFLNSSLLTGYVAGLPTSVGTQLDAERGIIRASATNASIPLLFSLVYDELKTMSKNRHIIEDDGSGKRIMLDENPYCFEQILPLRDSSDIKNQVEVTLQRLLGIVVAIEERLINCLVLRKVAIGSDNEQKRLTANNPRVFSSGSLTRFLNTRLDLVPVINEVDGEIDDIPLVTDNLNLASLKSQLAVSGLELVPDKRRLKVAVFTYLK